MTGVHTALVCPACGYKAVEVNEDGLTRIATLRCRAPKCTRPDAAQRILTEHGTPNHAVEVGRTTFSIVHPLIERLDHQLLTDCPLEQWMNALSGPPVTPGRYVVKAQPAEFRGFPYAFERVIDPDADPAALDGRSPHDPDAATKAADVDGVSA